MTARRILVTGGAGFIGIHLTRRLADEPGAEVTIVDNFSRGREDEEIASLVARPNVSVQNADLTDPAVWATLGEGYDEVYHLAAVIGVKHVLARPHDVVRVNALSTIHLLDWFVRGAARKLLFSSTSEAYAWTRQFKELPLPTPEDVPLSLTSLTDPRSSYAGSKIFGELAVNQYCQAHDARFTVVRYHNVYGPRMGREHVVPELLERALGGEDPLVVYSATHTRAFCYVSDAVDATVAVMRDPRADGLTFNVGNDTEEVTIEDLARRIVARVAPGVGIEPKTAANDPIERRCPDISRARRLIGYVPKVTLDEGLEATLAWYEPRLRAEAPTEAPSSSRS
jgi:UDP-glucose 4-epimerase/UDP-glucuronate decarboxylase